MFVLIVKEDQDNITKCLHGIRTCLQSVRPHVTIQHRSLSDQSDERFRIKCDKVIFLLSNRSTSVETAKTKWIANLPNIRNDNAKFRIIRLGATNERNKDVSNEKAGDVSKGVAVKTSNDDTGETSKGNAKEGSKDNNAKASKDNAKEASNDNIKELTNDSAGKTSKGNAKEGSKDNNTKESKDKAKEASNDNIKELTIDNAVEVSNDDVEEALKGKSAKASKDDAQEESKDNADELTDYNAEEASNDKAKKATDNGNKLKDDSIISVTSFENNVFQWWPNVLAFLFGRTSIGRWLNKDTVPSKHLYCLHCFPDQIQIAHPITGQLLNMLQTFGARMTDHSEVKQCCILLCKDAAMNLLSSQQSELVNSSKNVHIFAVALAGNNFSDELITHTDRCFTKLNLMSLILVLLTELNLINAKTRHQPAERQGSGVHVPTGLNFFIAHLVFMFNIPALLIQLAAAMICPWPFMVLFAVHDSGKKVKYVNLGFAVSSVAAIIIVIVTEIVLYPNFSPYPISVPVAIYLLIWQIGVGLKLHMEHDYKYGIFSIPSRVLTKV